MYTWRHAEFVSRFISAICSLWPKSVTQVLKTLGLCATHIVSADFMNLCSKYGVTLNLSYGGLYRKIVESFRRLCDF